MSDTIFAPITSISKSGVCIVRISGKDTVNALLKIGFEKNNLQHQKISFCKIKNPENGEILDESLISFFKSPNSFTGEDLAEISIHASPFILKSLLEILGNIENLRFAQNGEFSKRAFLNDKIDLTKAEAIPDLIAAETKAQHLQAMRQLQGQLGDIYESWRIKLIEISSMIEAAIDFPDEDLPQNIIDKVEDEVKTLKTAINNHLNDQNIGQKIKSGLNLAILGAPNVGKSSLINFLTKSDIAIVSDIKGTTRDIIESDLVINDIGVKICDTAGLRKTDDKIENEGIKRALKKAQEADIKIYMFDNENDKIAEEFSNIIDEDTIFVKNKLDLAEKSAQKYLNDNLIEISLKKNINCFKLTKELENKVQKLAPIQNHPIITQERYRVALKKSVENLDNFTLQKNIELASEDLRFAARYIGEIMGKIDIENILDVIFSKFCIGK